jgi:hypothetical protein
MLETRECGRDRLVQLRFKPLWLYVDAVREFCGFFARATFEDDGLGQRVGLIVHELIENAVRYGDDQELELRLERSNDDVVIRVINTTTEERATSLRKVIEELTRLSPADAYTRALHHAASLPPSQSGLGLPRVRYEGRVELELDTSPGKVSITARGTA